MRFTYFVCKLSTKQKCMVYTEKGSMWPGVLRAQSVVWIHSVPRVYRTGYAKSDFTMCWPVTVPQRCWGSDQAVFRYFPCTLQNIDQVSVPTHCQRALPSSTFSRPTVRQSDCVSPQSRGIHCYSTPLRPPRFHSMWHDRNPFIKFRQF